MGSLDGKRVDGVAGHAIVPTGEGDRLALKPTFESHVREPMISD